MTYKSEKNKCKKQSYFSWVDVCEFLEKYLFKPLVQKEVWDAGLWLSCNSHYPDRLGHLHVCLLKGGAGDPNVLFSFGNGKSLFLLAKINVPFISELLGKERKRTLEYTFIEAAVCYCTPLCIWDLNVTVNLHSILSPVIQKHSRESLWLTIIGHLTNSHWF